MTGKLRPRCFFDISVADEQAGRIVFELFDETCPRTCENFRALCTGEKGLGETSGKPLHFKGAPFHRIIKNFMVQAGDFTNGDGTGGESIYGGVFADENFLMKHDKKYLLSMANRGPNTNGSQFFITTQVAPHLDGKHVVFGHVLSGQELVKQVESMQADSSSRPCDPVKVLNCGELVPEIRVTKPKKSKRVAASSEDSSSDSDSDRDEKSRRKHAKKKAKKDRKKEKKKKKDKKRSKKSNAKSDSEDADVEEATAADPLSSVRPEEVPEIPENRFLYRGDRRKENGTTEGGEADDKRDASPEVAPTRSKRIHYSSTGRKIKGHGITRYNSRSRSRSRERTPPHWRREQEKLEAMPVLAKHVPDISGDGESRRADVTSNDVNVDKHLADVIGGKERVHEGKDSKKNKKEKKRKKKKVPTATLR